MNEQQVLKDVDDYLKAIPAARQEHFIDMVNHKLEEAKSDLSLSMKCTAEGNLLVLNQNGKEIQSDKIDKSKK